MYNDLIGKPVSSEEQRKIMLDIMKKLDTYFKRNQLKYCLVCGTLLGAIRHNGFIPWDDDFDIAMPLDDYNRFISLAQKKAVSDDIFISSPKTNPYHIWPMAKAISKKTRLVEPNVLEKYRLRQEIFGGVYVDIFPIVGVPDNPTERKKFCRKMCNLYEKVKRSSRVVAFAPGRSNILKKVIYNIFYTPYRIIGLDYYLKKLIQLSETYPFGTTQYSDNTIGLIDNMRCVNRTEYYLDTEYTSFEGLDLCIPKAYDEILKNQYGDYMKIPPESERRKHPREVYYLL